MNPTTTVYAHRNLRTKTWSVVDPSTGRVTDHPATLLLRRCAFRVRPAGRERALRERRRNVHAYVKGEPSPVLPPESVAGTAVHYHPGRAATFVTAVGEPVTGAAIVLLADDGRCWAWGLW